MHYVREPMVVTLGKRAKAMAASLRGTGFQAQMDSGLKDMTAASTAGRENSRDRNLASRKVWTAYAGLAKDEKITPVDFWERWYTATNAKDAKTGKDAVPDRSSETYKTRILECQSIHDAAKVDLDKLIECWPAPSQMDGKGGISRAVFVKCANAIKLGDKRSAVEIRNASKKQSLSFEEALAEIVARLEKLKKPHAQHWDRVADPVARLDKVARDMKLATAAFAKADKASNVGDEEVKAA